MSELKSLIRVKSKKIVTPVAPSSSLEVQYPNEWFRKNAEKKPTLNITLVTDSLEKARKMLRKGIIDNNINLGVATTFLFYFSDTLKTVLPETWTSYNRIIGQEGAEISPLSLLNVKSTQRGSDFRTTEVVSEADDSWMAGMVLSTYRLIRAPLSEYRAQIAQRITTQLKSLKSDAPAVSDMVDIYQGWMNDRTYNTLVAAYDMFFNRFPYNPASCIRIGTTGSRFRDCAALLSYGYLMNLLGLTEATGVLDWVFIEQIGDEIESMMTAPEELSDPFSYFPYQVDLGLVMKSAYSTTANPLFFDWVHTIGTLMKSNRSMNARHVSETRAADVFANAACVAFVYSTSFEFTKVYTADGAELKFEEEIDDGTEDDEAEVLKSKDPEDWVTLVKSRGGTLPPTVRQFISKIAKSIVEPREGSMSQYVRVFGANY